MKTEKIIPAWVVENFLPDCESRYRSLYPRGECDDMELEQWEEFCADNFPEALSELLKAQRDECATICGNAIDFHPVDVAGQVFNAPIPEPKNRK